jgi:23S rRNA pseudouridine1911/1915/1917 synthase
LGHDDAEIQRSVSSLLSAAKAPEILAIRSEFENLRAVARPLDGLVRDLLGVSWGRARDLVSRGKISVDGVVVTDHRKVVADAANVAFDVAARRSRDGLPDAAVVHVDAHVVVVDKPSGINTIPFDPGGMGASIARKASRGEPPALSELVARWLTRHDKAAGRASHGPASVGIVHRIDKETSGLVVFTRSWLAKKELTSAFRAHTVHRRYVALVRGAARSATHSTHLVPDRGDGIRGSVEKRGGRARAIGSEKTQLAVTHVEVLERFDDASLVACTLETGRTHQIRVHLSEAGTPLLGERVYVRGLPKDASPARRLMLHAAELGFVHPATGAEVRWDREPPADFSDLLARLRGAPGA